MPQETMPVELAPAEKILPQLNKRGIFRIALEDGGPGFCNFAINNACNASCSFCNFALGKLPRESWIYMARDGALDAVHILYRYGIRYLLITGGEPLLHPDLTAIVKRASDLGMKTMVVTNGMLLQPNRIRELSHAGLSRFIISIDHASRKGHEGNRGLPGVCERICDANALIKTLKLHSTASVTMSRMVDYKVLPGFLRSLGFDSVTFSYPLSDLRSNYLGYSDSDLVNFTTEELLDSFDQIKRMKKQFRVVNPTPSLEEMKRFLRKQEQRFPCLGGYQYFYLDWNLDLWRCFYWETPMCSIYEFDGSQRVRDGCTRCMIDCYRDGSVMHYIGVSVHDAYQALRLGKLRDAAKALMRPANLTSIRAVLEEIPWLLRV